MASKGTIEQLGEPKWPPVRRRNAVRRHNPKRPVGAAPARPNTVYGTRDTGTWRDGDDLIEDPSFKELVREIEQAFGKSSVDIHLKRLSALLLTTSVRKRASNPTASGGDDAAVANTQASRHRTLPPGVKTSVSRATSEPPHLGAEGIPAEHRGGCETLDTRADNRYPSSTTSRSVSFSIDQPASDKTAPISPSTAALELRARAFMGDAGGNAENYDWRRGSVGDTGGLIDSGSLSSGDNDGTLNGDETTDNSDYWEGNVDDDDEEEEESDKDNQDGTVPESSDEDAQMPPLPYPERMDYVIPWTKGYLTYSYWLGIRGHFTYWTDKNVMYHILYHTIHPPKGAEKGREG
ncbi:hypothetical protein EV182_006721 [Spiromyces aspiralis]|uniref:Uncharacterized protein n=1 Tax=Spiromyces aspiralis TaxID=68401 RepID=A0ACC1H8E8_9FUNG|nr:hypothetical protein EV182_006721 [Spiromyces aspiralis]